MLMPKVKQNAVGVMRKAYMSLSCSDLTALLDADGATVCALMEAQGVTVVDNVAYFKRPPSIKR
jgi:hypothetical protein